MSYSPEQLGQRLRAARKAAGYKVAREIAKHANIPESTYSQHEAGKRALSPDMLVSYCQYFQISPGWLLTGEGSPYPLDKVNPTQEAILIEELKNTDYTGPIESAYKQAIIQHRFSIIDMELFSEILTQIMTALIEKRANLTSDELMDFATTVYNGIVQTSASKEDKQRIIELSITSLQQGMKKHSEIPIKQQSK